MKCSIISRIFFEIRLKGKHHRSFHCLETEDLVLIGVLLLRWWTQFMTKK